MCEINLMREIKGAYLSHVVLLLLAAKKIVYFYIVCGFTAHPLYYPI